MVTFFVLTSLLGVVFLVLFLVLFLLSLLLILLVILFFLLQLIATGSVSATNSDTHGVLPGIGEIIVVLLAVAMYFERERLPLQLGMEQLRHV